MISFSCPVCKKILSVPDDQRGAKIPCTHCGQRLQVPPHSRDKTLLGRPVSGGDPGLSAQRAAGGASAASKAPSAVLEPPPPPTEALWYYSHQGQRCGPIPWADLRQRVAAHQLQPGDLVWTPGMTYWSAAETIPGLLSGSASQRPAAPPPIPAAGPPPLPPPASRRPRPTGSPWWKRALAETWAITRATIAAPFVLLAWPFTYLANQWRLRALRRASLEAQAALGQRLCETKGGDAHLRSQIEDLSDRILSLETTMGPTRVLQAERRGLLLRLAAPILTEETPPSGVEPEHRRARAAQTALLTYEEQRMGRAAHQPAPRVRWRRLGIGYGVLGCIVALLLLFLWNNPWDDEADESSGLRAEAGARGAGGAQKDANKGRKKGQKDGKSADKEARPDQQDEDPEGQGEMPLPNDGKEDDKQEGPVQNNDKPNKKDARPADKGGKQPRKDSKVPRNIKKDRFAQAQRAVALVRSWPESRTGFLIQPGVVVVSWYAVRATPVEQLKISFPAADDVDAKPLSATVLYFDQESKLTFLKVDTEVPPLELASELQLKVGIQLSILNNSLTKEDAEHWSPAVIRGTLLARNPRMSNFYSIRIPAQRGHVGGPVLDKDGRVIGVVTLRLLLTDDIVYAVRLESLRSAVDAARSATPQAQARAARLHERGVPLWRMALIGEMQAKVQQEYENTFQQASQNRTEPVQALGKKKDELGEQLQDISQELKEGERLLKRLNSTSALPLGTRLDLTSLLALCKKMQRHVENVPTRKFGPVAPYLQTGKDLLGRLRAQVTSLLRDPFFGDLSR